MPNIESIIADLRTLVDYNWDSELSDYQESHDGSGNLNGMFPLLVRVRNWLDGTDEGPSSFLEMPEGITDAMIEAVSMELGREVLAHELADWLDDHNDDGDAFLLAKHEALAKLVSKEGGEELFEEIDGIRAVLAARKAERNSMGLRT